MRPPRPRAEWSSPAWSLWTQKAVQARSWLCTAGRRVPTPWVGLLAQLPSLLLSPTSCLWPPVSDHGTRSWPGPSVWWAQGLSPTSFCRVGASSQTMFLPWLFWAWLLLAGTRGEPGPWRSHTVALSNRFSPSKTWEPLHPLREARISQLHCLMHPGCGVMRRYPGHWGQTQVNWPIVSVLQGQQPLDTEAYHDQALSVPEHPETSSHR